MASEIERSRQSVSYSALAFIFLLIIPFVVLDYSINTGIESIFTQIPDFIRIPLKTNKYIFIAFRILFSICWLLAFILMAKRKLNDDIRSYRIFGYPFFLLSLLFWYGYIKNHYYNVVAIPLIIIFQLYFAQRFSKAFLKEFISSEYPLSRVSNIQKNEAMSFSFSVRINLNPQALTDNEREWIFSDMNIHSPQQSMFIQGGNGAGKSASLVEPIHFQAVMKGYSMIVYDYKGEDSPLSRGIYNAIKHKDENPHLYGKYKTPNFVYLNPIDPLKSMGKLNPFNPKYITNKPLADQSALTFLMNIDPSLREKTDFWGNNQIMYTSAVIWFMKRLSHSNPKYARCCTFAHINAMLMSPIMDVVNALMSDDDVVPYVRSIIGAKMNDAGEQLSGIEATIHVGCGRVRNKELYWMFNPLNDEEEIDIKINDPNNPTIICICSSEQAPEAMTAPVGVTINSVLKSMMKKGEGGYHKTLVSIDELPTIFLYKIDHVMATMRSKNIPVLLSIQEWYQLIRDYGKENANVILGTCGTQFFGMMNEGSSAKSICEMFPEYLVPNENISTNSNDETVGVSHRKEKSMTVSRLQTQPLGHFSGKIAGGDPAVFSCQFPNGETHELLGMNSKDELLDIPINPIIDSSNEDLMRDTLSKLMEDNMLEVEREVNEILSTYATDSVS